MTTTLIPNFAPLIGPYLARQSWAQSALGSFGEANLPAVIVDVEVLRTAHPGMASVVVESETCTFHLVLGWRSVTLAPGVLGAQSGAVLGPGQDGTGDVLVYDALADSELVVALLDAVSGGAEQAGRGRVVQSLVSHSALVYDDRLFMKCYRVLEKRPRPEIEMVRRLHEAGFNNMLTPVANWQRGGCDLALVREFVPGAVEGLALARTSLRDLLARAHTSEDGAAFEDVGRAGGDLAPEMRRLGATTAAMHLALAEAFGVEHFARAPGEGGAGAPGDSTIRVHGDYHLRRVMRTDAGWLVAGFGDDPLMGASAGAASQGEGHFGSPLEDLADLCCSLGITAAEAVSLQARNTRPNARHLAAGWEQHNIDAFVNGYVSHPGIDPLIPPDRDVFDALLRSLMAQRRTREAAAGAAAGELA